jgi:hypothetical protein
MKQPEITVFPLAYTQLKKDNKIFFSLFYFFNLFNSLSIFKKVWFYNVNHAGDTRQKENTIKFLILL